MVGPMLNRTITYRSMSSLATLLFVILLILVYFNSNQSEPPLSRPALAKNKLEFLKSRVQAPNIIWKNLKQQKASLAHHRGKVVYLNLWALWCEPCKQEIPMIANIASELLSEPLEILMVNVDEDKSEVFKAQDFLSKKGPQLPGLFNSGDIFLKAFNTDILPAHILIDKNGRVAANYFGDIIGREKDFKRMLQHLLQETPASN